MLDNGKFVIAWADAEEPDFEFSFFDIRLQAYASNGTLIGSEVVINDIPIEVDPSDQESPAITIDEAGNIVVAWTALSLIDCIPEARHIFARRLFWDETTTPAFVDAPFRVDSADEDLLQPTNAVLANPAVALTSSTDEGQCGRFIVAWNVTVHETVPTQHEIHAQYFGPDGRPISGEFRVNQATDDTEEDVANTRRLADSGQHTIDYGPDGQVVVVWTAHGFGDAPLDVYYTLLPGGFEEQLAAEANCVKGDVNIDGLADGADIQPFVDFLLGNSHCFSILNLCGADCNCDGQLTMNDVPPFVDVLLTKSEGCTGFIGCDESTHGTPPDCNGNEIPDATDILFHCDAVESPEYCDCNLNGVPDGCDLADATSTDIDEDSRPDECEVDCNDNSIPDDYEIEELMVDDCDSNGVPDECDFDCDGNEIPDACETADPDCNENGIIDACEDDCNGNSIPDDCELDGNDCNENGRLDSCDIDEGPPFGSLDTDENEIPDECEEEEFMTSGGSPCDASFTLEDYSVLSNELYAAWEEFTLWCMLEEWGPDSEFSGAEQLERLIAKKYEVGICEEGESE